jgi:hypothetical protein
MSATASIPSRSRYTSKYTTVVVGHGSSAAMIPMLVAPGIHAAIPDKAMAFDFLFNQLRAFLRMLSAADLTTALANHFDVNYSITHLETNTVITAVKAALFHSDNLSGIRFLDHTGTLVNTAISEDPDLRPDGVAFFVFATTVTGLH